MTTRMYRGTLVVTAISWMMAGSHAILVLQSIDAARPVDVVSVLQLFSSSSLGLAALVLLLRAPVREDAPATPRASSPAPSAARPHTSRAQHAIALADAAASDRGDGFVGTEHLLLGLLAERTGPAAQMLAELGVTRERVDALLARSRAHA